MSRPVWQGDVLYFIRNEIPGTRNTDFLNLSQEIVGIPLAPARISEIIQVSKSGHIGRAEFAEAEDIFYSRFFSDRTLDTVFSKLLIFVKSKDLSFPDSAFLPGDTKEAYIRRFLRYGLSNMYTPDSSVYSASQSELISEIVLPGESDPCIEEVHISDPKNNYYQKLLYVIKTNWFFLFVNLIFTVMLSMYLFSTKTELTALFLLLLRTPAPTFVAILMVLAVLPKAIGLLESFAFYFYIKHFLGIDGNFISIAKFGIKNRKGIFDPERINLIHGLFCNVTCALCTIAFFLYANRLSGFLLFIGDHSLNLALSSVLLTAVLISLNWVFLMQTKPAPKTTEIICDNPDNYLLTRLHVLSNMFFILVVLFLDMSMILYILWYGFVSRSFHLALDYFFVFLPITAYLYLWYVSVSPHAKALKVNSWWMIHIIPVFSVISSLYAVCFFAPSGATGMCVLVNIVGLFIWLKEVLQIKQLAESHEETHLLNR